MPGSFLPNTGYGSTVVVASMLAAWKAGAAFALLSPDMPRDLRDSILRELPSDVSLNVDGDTVQIVDSTDSLLDILPLLYSTTLLPGSRSDELSLPSCGLSDASYVIFKSGITGEPKGVAIEHSTHHIHLMRAFSRSSDL